MSGRFAVVLVTCITLGCLACGARNSGGDEAGAESAPPGTEAEGLNTAAGGIDLEELQVFDFSDHFSYEPLGVGYSAPEYELPLEVGDIADFSIAASGLGLDEESRALLLKNGFAVTGFAVNPSGEDIVAAYKIIGRLDVPVFITSGSLLHIYHILFGDLLRSIESEHLFDDLWNLTYGLLDHLGRVDPEAGDDVREAVRRDAAFLAVGLSLLRPKEDQIPEAEAAPEGRFMMEATVDDFTAEDLARYAFEIPESILDEVQKELDLITRHEGFHPSPIFLYEEDYSQYVPRGHYTRTEKLKNYFRAMIWFGRMTMLLKGSSEVSPGTSCRTCEAFISDHDARIQTLGAVRIAALMAEDEHLLDLWERIYRVTSFFVGFSDDLGPYEYLEALNEVFGWEGGRSMPAALDADQYGRLKARLAECRSPLIYGGTGDCMILPPFTPEQADACLDKTRGFRLMGQRFVPDSYIMSKLVAPHVGEYEGMGVPFTAAAVAGAGVARVFPRGLDVMAVLGSQRAREILDELEDASYKDFDKAFGEVQAEIDAIDDRDWNQNLYWNWLWSLKGLQSEFGSGRPTFMQTAAWKDRLLTTALASWAQLRHDTILYAKQSYTLALGAVMPQEGGGGYVEPVPEFYNRLLSLTRMTRSGLGALGFLDDAYVGRLTQLEATLESLIRISLAELRGEPLSMEDSRWVADFADVLDSVVGDLDEESLKTTIVADVHTDTNTDRVLEEGTGYVDLIVVAWKEGASIRLAAGPELSYFEFKHPMSDRLTDEAWREKLRTAPPERPAWAESYLR